MGSTRQRHPFGTENARCVPVAITFRNSRLFSSHSRPFLPNTANAPVRSCRARLFVLLYVQNVYSHAGLPPGDFDVSASASLRIIRHHTGTLMATIPFFICTPSRPVFCTVLTGQDGVTFSFTISETQHYYISYCVIVNSLLLILAN